MSKQSDLMSKWVEVRASTDSHQKKPSECSTFSELFDEATEAGQNAAAANDGCTERLRDLDDAEAALTAAQAALAAAFLEGPVAVTAASLAVASTTSARNNAKSAYDAASKAQDKALELQKQATAAMVSHRNSCPTCLQ